MSNSECTLLVLQLQFIDRYGRLGFTENKPFLRIDFGIFQTEKFKKKFIKFEN